MGLFFLYWSMLSNVEYNQVDNIRLPKEVKEMAEKYAKAILSKRTLK